jgi:hypothetical protein
MYLDIEVVLTFLSMELLTIVKIDNDSIIGRSLSRCAWEDTLVNERGNNCRDAQIGRLYVWTL